MLDRLRGELGRFGSIAEASRRIGEPDPLGLRDACNGRKRLTAEVLARLAAEGVDALYVLTGRRISSKLDLEPMERALLNDFNRCSPEDQVEAVKYMALLAEGLKPQSRDELPGKPGTKSTGERKRRTTDR